MRWSIIRLIWLRELRDQLRDRRTLFMIVGLPILLYPVAGIGLLQMALGFVRTETRIGVVGSEHLPPWSPRFAAETVLPTWLACTPVGPGTPLVALERAAAVASLGTARRSDFPPLLQPAGDGYHFLKQYFEDPARARGLLVQPFPEGEGREALKARRIDLLLVVAPGFAQQLEQGGQPTVTLLGREGDDRSRLANTVVSQALLEWKKVLKDARLLRAGLATDYDVPFVLVDPERARPVRERAADELFKILGQIFPFVLVMWSLAGALYPAVDLCAGEKERGTMETLLISPASREEIVWGKFLTIWVFSGATALLNLVSMGLTTWWFGSLLAESSFRISILLWGVVLLLPLSAFFSALGLAVGVYARSSKEGQYYLMPLFLLTMPLIFLTLAPGVELNAFYSMVPVTGVALLLQALMSPGAPTSAHWLYFIPVLAPMVIYSWLALRWAIDQFQREEVLFREAEQLDVRLWLRHLWRDKEDLPTAGEAFFCFTLVLVLGRVGFALGASQASLPGFFVAGLAFVAAPPLLMAVLLTRRPVQALALVLPSWRSLSLSAALALLLFLPGAQLSYFILQQVPGVKHSLQEFFHTLQGAQPGEGASTQVLLVMTFLLLLLALLQGVCEELAFRGFILTGLQRRFRPLTAALLSAFLFALFQMNVFQLLPHFLLGTVLALLTQRAGSVLPAMLFHFIFNALVYLGLLVGPMAFPGFFVFFVRPDGALSAPGVILGALAFLTAMGLLAGLVWRTPRAVGPQGPGPEPAAPDRPEKAHQASS